ncbi:MAG: Fur family transcriptional regulator [Verrucomicrobiales bacterium]
MVTSTDSESAPPADAAEAPKLELLGDLRMTKQRQVVFDVLMEQRDHPTASEVFMRVKDRMPTISLATVYNCLETLSQCGVVKTVNVERGSARYCPNQKDHAHFFCVECGAITDVDLGDGQTPTSGWQMPDGVQVDQFEVAFRGTCPSCAKKNI